MSRKMATKYSPNNIITFKINDIDYALYESVIKKMGIFDNILESFGSVNDVNLRNEIATIEMIDLIIDILSTGIQNETSHIKNLSLEKLLQMTSVMRFLLIDEKYITDCYSIFTEKHTLIETAYRCSKISFFYEMFYLVDHLTEAKCRVARETVSVKTVVHKIINGVSFPKALKYSWTKLLLTHSIREQTSYFNRLLRIRNTFCDGTNCYSEDISNFFDNFYRQYELNKNIMVLIRENTDRDLDVDISGVVYPIGKEKMCIGHLEKLNFYWHGDKSLIKYLERNETIAYDTVYVEVDLTDVIISHLTNIFMELIVD